MKKDDVDKGAIVVEETEVMPCCFPNFKSFSVKSKDINEGMHDYSSLTYVLKKKDLVGMMVNGEMLFM